MPPSPVLRALRVDDADFATAQHPVRARALLDGRFAPSVDDVLELAEPVLKHRMALTFAARAEGETIPNVIRRLKARIG